MVKATFKKMLVLLWCSCFAHEAQAQPSGLLKRSWHALQRKIAFMGSDYRLSDEKTLTYLLNANQMLQQMAQLNPQKAEAIADFQLEVSRLAHASMDSQDWYIFLSGLGARNKFDYQALTTVRDLHAVIQQKILAKKLTPTPATDKIMSLALQLHNITLPSMNCKRGGSLWWRIKRAKGVLIPTAVGIGGLTATIFMGILAYVDGQQKGFGVGLDTGLDTGVGIGLKTGVVIASRIDFDRKLEAYDDGYGNRPFVNNCAIMICNQIDHLKAKCDEYKKAADTAKKASLLEEIELGMEIIQRDLRTLAVSSTDKEGLSYPRLKILDQLYAPWSKVNKALKETPGLEEVRNKWKEEVLTTIVDGGIADFSEQFADVLSSFDFPTISNPGMGQSCNQSGQTCLFHALADVYLLSENRGVEINTVRTALETFLNSFSHEAKKHEAELSEPEKAAIKKCEHKNLHKDTAAYHAEDFLTLNELFILKDLYKKWYNKTDTSPDMLPWFRTNKIKNTIIIDRNAGQNGCNGLQDLLFAETEAREKKKASPLLELLKDPAKDFVHDGFQLTDAMLQEFKKGEAPLRLAFCIRQHWLHAEFVKDRANSKVNITLIDTNTENTGGSLFFASEGLKSQLKVFAALLLK